VRRFKSVDIFRGLCIFYMNFGHLIEWWVSYSDYWLYEFIWNYGAPVGGGGFLLVSGISAALSYRSRLLKAQKSNDVNLKMIRNEYLIRALIILMISTVWNFLGTLYMNLPGVWLWFVIQTISISLLLAWPFFKTSKIFRTFVSFTFWVGNEFVFAWLSPFQGQNNIMEIIFFILYNSPEQNVILGYFPFLLMGTVIGDILFEASIKENESEQKDVIIKKMIKPSLIGGAMLLLFGIIYNYPDFGDKTTFSSHMFIFGIELLLLSFLLYFKDLGKYDFKKKYFVIEYYSYYSFTIFLAHNLLFFIFPPQFNALEIWIYIVPAMILWTLLFRFIYKKWGKYGSLKFFMSKAANYLAVKIEVYRSNNQKAMEIYE
jgi:hypothetical protein